MKNNILGRNRPFNMGGYQALRRQVLAILIVLLLAAQRLVAAHVEGFVPAENAVLHVRPVVRRSASA